MFVFFGKSVIYTYNVGFPINFVMAPGDRSKLRMVANMEEYANKYNSIQSGVF